MLFVGIKFFGFNSMLVFGVHSWAFGCILYLLAACGVQLAAVFTIHDCSYETILFFVIATNSCCKRHRPATNLANAFNGSAGWQRQL